MTRKDFDLIAATLKDQKPSAERGIEDVVDAEIQKWGEIVEAFADMCAAQSPRFDRDLFLKACGAV